MHKGQRVQIIGHSNMVGKVGTIVNTDLIPGWVSVNLDDEWSLGMAFSRSEIAPVSLEQRIADLEARVARLEGK